MKKVLITGINTGIGMGLAKFLLQNGYFVIGCVRKPEYFDLLIAEFKGFKGQYALYAFDLKTDFTEKLKEIECAHGVPEVIINNSGVFLTDSDDFESRYSNIISSLEVNLKAPMRICEYFAPKMRALPWGRIINISSKMGSLGDNASGGYLSYRSSKALLNLYTINLAHQMADSKIVVLTLHPGWIKTRMGGMGAPDEIGAAVERIAFALTDEASEFHGEFLVGKEKLPW